MTLLARLALGVAVQMQFFDQSAIWRPAADFREKVLAACQWAGARFGDCFAEQLKQSGAPAAALGFSRLLHDNGYMQAFRAAGRVGIAAVFYPFRANENDGLVLINGEPSPVDVDELRSLPTAEMKKDAAYGAMAAQQADPTLWPGDRSSPDGPLLIRFGDGSEEFILDYLVRQQCHACAVLGQAFFSFRFDAHGKLAEKSFTGFKQGWSGARTALRERMVVIKPETTFTVWLPANRGTGYSWSLAPADAAAPVQQVENQYQSAGISRPGAGGEEQWEFRTGPQGQGLLRFEYRRSWEKSAAPAKTLELFVRVG